MADTNFTDGVTLTAASWFNDINDSFYTAFGGVAGAGTITKVQFPATQVPSADANALDDYEEGTWTPVFTAVTPGNIAVTYSAQVGLYTKIGRQVTVSFSITTSVFTHTTAAGNALVTGLPFTSNATSGYASIGSLYWSGADIAAGYTQMMCAVGASVTQLTVVAMGDNQAGATAGITSFPTGGTPFLFGTITYFV